VKTVLAHGCFDVIHIGHIRLLKAARAMGDELVVSLLSDRFVTAAKGAGRPVHTLEARAEHLRELRCVDRVVVVNGPGSKAVERMIDSVRPAIYVKGANCRGLVPEKEFLKSIGTELVFLDMVKLDGEPMSTTRILETFAP
jgi:rfaE bifunctional protein nucleotidyltransferase chain/domain